eukprot:scaffold109_cov252-Pinguiococcus_pyrenoidosus.AAC.59
MSTPTRKLDLAAPLATHGATHLLYLRPQPCLTSSCQKNSVCSPSGGYCARNLLTSSMEPNSPEIGACRSSGCSSLLRSRACVSLPDPDPVAPGHKTISLRRPPFAFSRPEDAAEEGLSLTKIHLICFRCALSSPCQFMPKTCSGKELR